MQKAKCDGMELGKNLSVAKAIEVLQMFGIELGPISSKQETIDYQIKRSLGWAPEHYLATGP